MTVGRASWGTLTLIAPRYYTHSLLVTIGLVGLGYVLWDAKNVTSSRLRGVGFGAVTVVVSVLTVFSWIGGVDGMQYVNAQNRQRLLTLRLMDAIPSNLLWQHLEPAKPRIVSRFLIERGILTVDRIGGWLGEKIDSPDEGSGGGFQIVGETERRFALDGFAELPGRGVPADFVILARKSRHGETEIVTGILVGKSRPDIAAINKSADLLFSGFDHTLDLPSYADAQLEVFAVDLDNRRVYRLRQHQETSKVVTHTFAYHLDGAEITGERRDSVQEEEVPWTLGNERRWVLTQPTSSDIVFKNVFVEKGSQLEFGVGIHETAWDRPGVTFEIGVQHQGSAETVFSQRIDPKNNPADRRWSDHAIDLGGFAGREVTFRFRTAGEAAGDSRTARSGWSRPQIVSRLGSAR